MPPVDVSAIKSTLEQVQRGASFAISLKMVARMIPRIPPPSMARALELALSEPKGRISPEILSVEVSDLSPWDCRQDEMRSVTLITFPQSPPCC